MCNCGGTCNTAAELERIRAERDALKRQLSELCEAGQWQSIERNTSDAVDKNDESKLLEPIRCANQ